MAAEALRVGLPLVKETLPEAMRRRLGLADLAAALRMIHQPESMHEVRRGPAAADLQRVLPDGTGRVARGGAASMASHNAPPIPVSDKVDAAHPGPVPVPLHEGPGQVDRRDPRPTWPATGR